MRVLTVVSCGGTKQELAAGETVPARELYSSSVHTCKDRYGRHSHGYCIASAKYGLVENARELPWYDQTISDMDDIAVEAWSDEVAGDLAALVGEEGYDAVVIIGGRDYTRPLSEHFEEIDADVLTPWQTSDYVTGVGRGMAWCNDEARWPVNVSTAEEIGEVVG